MYIASSFFQSWTSTHTLTVCVNVQKVSGNGRLKWVEPPDKVKTFCSGQADTMGARVSDGEEGEKLKVVREECKTTDKRWGGLGDDKKSVV